ncbi:hypothetical protein LTR53_008340 [Teratosphaeriaceae sp. CCFEE 6253]|nr:hypothetical protein LTR53_008340 [Teratosphaeriaceae sp. CCFEE 6253]
MSKFFRSSDSDTSSSEDDVENDRTGAIHVDQVETEDGTQDITTALSTLNSAFQGIDNGVHSQMLLHALLEERCMNEALREHASGANGHARNDEGVRRTAKAKYQHLCTILAPHNLISSGLERDELAAARQRYRDGLSLLSRRTSPVAVQHSRTLIPPTRHLPRAGAGSETVPSSRLELARVHTETSATFDALAPAHPVLQPSRYLQDFDELAILGKGGYGIVYHVRNRLDGLEYAVKKVPVSPARVARIRRRGQQELDQLLIELLRYFTGWLEWIDVGSLQSRGSGSRPSFSGEASTLSDDEGSAEEGAADDRFTRETVAQDDNESANVVFETSDRRESLGEAVSKQSQSSIEIRDTTELVQRVADPSLALPTDRQAVDATFETSDTHSESRVRFSRSAAKQSHSYSAARHAYDLIRQDGGPSLALHLQMGVYPTTLADFLSTTPVAAAPRMAHCFHVQPSIRILLALIDGVEYLHSQGIVHRDLKPANIFLATNRNPRRTRGAVDLLLCADCRAAGGAPPMSLEVRIGDFGLVTALARPALGMDTVVGTAHYQPTRRPELNAHLDVFALGIIAFELLYAFGTRMERHEAIQQLKEEGTFPQRFHEHIDPTGHMGNCINDMLAHNPEVTLQLLRERLEGVLEVI